MNGTSALSGTDALAVMNGRDGYGFGDGAWFWIIIILFAFWATMVGEIETMD